MRIKHREYVEKPVSYFALFILLRALSAEGNSFLGRTEWNAPFISLKEAAARVPPAVSIMCEKVQLPERGECIGF
jgi:hypothetical protein